MPDLVFCAESPLADDLTLLFRRHTAEMQADTPPESIHMIPREGLVADDIDFYVLRRTGVPVGMAALKRLDDRHGEIKSMHVLAEERGAGLSRRLLEGLIDRARRHGLDRLSLETGAQESFAAARSLYQRAGFVECRPFGAYRPDPLSVFMTLALAESVTAPPS